MQFVEDLSFPFLILTFWQLFWWFFIWFLMGLLFNILWSSSSLDFPGWLMLFLVFLQVKRRWLFRDYGWTESALLHIGRYSFFPLLKLFLFLFFQPDLIPLYNITLQGLIVIYLRMKRTVTGLLLINIFSNLLYLLIDLTISISKLRSLTVQSATRFSFNMKWWLFLFNSWLYPRMHLLQHRTTIKIHMSHTILAPRLLWCILFLWLMIKFETKPFLQHTHDPLPILL